MTANFNLSSWALRHRALVWFLMVIVATAGSYSYWRLGRSEDPPFTTKTMIVRVDWPGATVSEMLDQVTDRVEEKLQETPHLDYLRSFTTPGETTIFVNLLSSTPALAVPDAWYQVHKKIGDIRWTLPPGIVGPFFNDEFGDTYGIIYAFTADGFTQRELRDYVKAVRRRLLAIPDVAKIELFGTQDEKIFIEFSPEKMAGLHLSRQSLIEALQAQNAVTPAGTVRTRGETLQVQVSGRFHSQADLEQFNFAADGRLFRLSDIGTIKRGYADPPQPSFRINGQQAIGLGIAMRAGGDALALGANVERAMVKITADLPIGVEPHLVADQPKIVKHAVGDFLEALAEFIAIVVAVSLISLGLRAGAVVACSIPMVLAGTFIVMSLGGIDLQRVSLGALIIALGLLVDDAMITVESIVARRERGADMVAAATFAYSATAFPMLTGTLVTVAGFLPVGFARSTAGEYTFSLFAVIAIALLISWIVAILFAPLLGVSLLPQRVRHQTDGEPGPAMRHFRRFLRAALRARWITIGTTLALFGLAVFGLSLVPRQFFPSSDRPELLINLKLAQNTTIEATARAATVVDSLLKDDPDVDHWTDYIGEGAIRFYLPLDVQLPNQSIAQVVVVAKDLAGRSRLQGRLGPAIAQKLPQLVARLSPLELGPPVGWPIQYRVAGPAISEIRDIAYQVTAIMAGNSSVDNINFDWIEPQRTLRLRVDQDEARLLGINSELLAQTIDAFVSGITVTKVRDGNYLVDVIARADAHGRVLAAALRTLAVPLPNGATVPLSQLAKVEYGQDWPLIWRRDRVPTLTVQSDVVAGALPATVVHDLRLQIDRLNRRLPPGYSVTAGGSEEESNKSLNSVIAVVPVAGLLMLIVLMAQLQNLSQLFLVISVVPFGLIGVVGALLIAHKPLGFVAILGVLSLTGMIIRNSVILVDQIGREIVGHRTPWDAVIEATAHRCRPILLTAAAAILGMIPIASTVFWGPMAYAIMGGLAIATILTLVFLPALYVAWFNIREDRPGPGSSGES